LHVLVNPGGSRLWRMAYRLAGKQNQLAHFEGSVRSTYNAAEWLDGRREFACRRSGRV
jgi:hypothetical protein